MNGHMFFKLGDVQGLVYGGPYVLKPAHMKGVKMAEEINKPCDIDVPTRDFSVPDPETLRAGLKQAVQLIANGEHVYVGCMGGIGRTGLFLAGLAKMMEAADEDMQGLTPVQYVRAQYIPHAVETRQQQKFIEDLRVDDLLPPKKPTYQGLFGFFRKLFDKLFA